MRLHLSTLRRVLRRAGYSGLATLLPADLHATGRQAFMGWSSLTALTAELFVAAVNK